MKRLSILRHAFVRSIPRDLEDGILYVSMDFATVIHKCCCGCGNQVVTPLSPAEWTLSFDGLSISLQPSVGNWSFACKSHYWIRKSRVVWAEQWSDAQVATNRRRDQADLESHTRPTAAVQSREPEVIAVPSGKPWWRRVFDRIR